MQEEEAEHLLQNTGIMLRHRGGKIQAIISKRLAPRLRWSKNGAVFRRFCLVIR